MQGIFSQIFILHIDNKQKGLIMYKMLLGIAGVGSEILAWENVEGFFCDSLTTATTLELGLILFSEAVSSREKVPAPLFIHVPHIGFLASIFSWILTDQVHQEKPRKEKYRVIIK